MAVRVLNILGDNDLILSINAHLLNIVYDINASTPTQISWFNDPEILLRIVVLVVSLETLNKFAILLGDAIGLRKEIQLCSAVSLSHLVHVYAQTVFSSDFIALWEMVYFLVFI